MVSFVHTLMSLAKHNEYLGIPFMIFAERLQFWFIYKNHVRLFVVSFHAMIAKGLWFYVQFWSNHKLFCFRSLKILLASVLKLVIKIALPSS